MGGMGGMGHDSTLGGKSYMLKYVIKSSWLLMELR
jgi:hypothetical protein